MIDRALEYNWIYRKEVKLPFTDQHLAYDKKALQNVYAYGIVKVTNEMNSYQKAQQHALKQPHF